MTDLPESRPRISVASVDKDYVKYDDAPLLLGSLFRMRTRTKRSTLHALRDIDLTVGDGEFVGVIGRNGSGKSTLLRLLAGVTAPTRGRVEVRGMVAPLIAVGVGFEPELTGRENVFVNGSILGIPRSEVEARLDEIVAFAEIEEFIDTPVKFYSSGMFVRLGFAASVLAEPDVLLVDEVLAVGDLPFQVKCFERMAALREQGTTVVVVSHNLASIRRTCDRTIVLHDGEMVHDGATPDAISLYHDLVVAETEEALGERRAELLSFELLDERGEPVRRVPHGATVTARMHVRAAEIQVAVANVSVSDATGLWVFGQNSDPSGFRLGPGESTVSVELRTLLAEGSYDLRMSLGDAHGRPICGVGGPVSLYVEGRPRVKGVADLDASFALDGQPLPR